MVPMPVHKTLLRILLAAGILLSVLQFWLPAYYLTCDGPCHLYNARIVHDVLSGSGGTSLFGRFYEVRISAIPNNFTTFTLALLLTVFNGAIAAKLLYTLYVLVFISGFLVLLRRLGVRDSYWLLVVFLFPVSYAFAKGFSNFSFGLAFWFWMVAAWLRYLDEKRLLHLVPFIIVTAITYFTHLLPFVLGVGTCAALILSYSCSPVAAPHRVRYLFIRMGILLAGTLPFIVLAVLFTSGEGGLGLSVSPHPYRLIELLQFKYLKGFTDSEEMWALVAGVLLTAAGLVVIVRLLKRYAIHRYDGFFLVLLASFFAYTFFPEEFMGRILIISIRMQWFIMIIVACIAAFRLQGVRYREFAGGILFLCFIIISISRMSAMQEASAALEPHMQAGNYIRAGSTVLALDFSPGGRRADGSAIMPLNPVFHHASQYLGSDKPLIFMDNYEANTGYFPVAWKYGVNPYVFLGRGGSHEAQMPAADIEGYEQHTGIAVDYVLMWGYTAALAENAAFRKLTAPIDSGWRLVYTSAGDNTRLYARIGL